MRTGWNPRLDALLRRADPAARLIPEAVVTSAVAGANHGQFDLLDLIVLRGAGWTMDAVRNRFGIAV